MSFAIKVPAVSSGIRTALKRFLAVASVSEAVAQDNENRFSVTTGAGTFLGVKPIVAAVAAANPSVLGANRNERAVVNQWITTALQVNCQAVTLREVEPMISSKGGCVAGTDAPSPADLFLYCAAATEVLTNAKTYPNLSAWVRNVEKSSLIQPVKVATVAPEESASATETGGKGGKVKAARPSDEAIAAMRAEKEAAKAAKDAAKAAGGDAAEPATDKKKKTDKPEKKVVKKAVNPAELDIRIGKMLEVKPHPDSDKLLVEKIDLGDKEGPRTIASGLAQYYKAEELVGSHCLVLCNMKPRSIAGISSAGMVLCASTDAGALSLVTAPEAAPASRVVVGVPDVPEAFPPIPSGKQLEELIKHFHTDANGVVHWQDQPLLIGGKVQITSKIPNAIVK